MEEGGEEGRGGREGKRVVEEGSEEVTSKVMREICSAGTRDFITHYLPEHHLNEQKLLHQRIKGSKRKSQ